MTKAADRSSFQIYVTVKPRLYLCKNLIINNKYYCIFRDQTVWNLGLFIFMVINSYISFIEIKNLMKILLSLNCQQLHQDTRTYFARPQNM